MIAPEPFFEARGTPFSEFHRLCALTTLGHQVDLVTYPFGQPVTIPGVRIFRCARPPFIGGVSIGPSFAKIPLDFLLACTAVRRAASDRYDAVHSHEEGGVIGVILAWLMRVPHLYDMHSSLPQQLTNFAFSRSRGLRALFAAIERFMIRRSRVIVVICPSLEDTVRRIDPTAQAVLIENAPGSVGEEAAAAEVDGIRQQLIQTATPDTPSGSSRHLQLVIYTGTFEAYQGLDLLLAAMVVARRSCPRARLVLVGGNPDQVAVARAQARAAGVEDITVFAGRQPASAIPAYLRAADVLVSPRSRGTNTPLKIYQYLRSERPIVATRLLTHTQVLTDATAILTDATPEDFGAGIVAALQDPDRAAAIGRAARNLAEAKYSYESYLEKTRRACDLLGTNAPPAVDEPRETLGADPRVHPKDVA